MRPSLQYLIELDPKVVTWPLIHTIGRGTTVVPKQILYYSRDPKGNIMYEDSSSLRLCSIPKSLTNSKGRPLFNLAKGYGNFVSFTLNRKLSKIYDMLGAVKFLETRDKAKIDANFITSRGPLVDIATLLVNPSPFELNICCLDGQIIMASNSYRDEIIKEKEILKARFSGFKFESILTDQTVVENNTCFKTVIKTNIGSNKVVFSAEVDTCLKPSELVLPNYVELKSAYKFDNTPRYQRKMFTYLLQCLVSGTEHLIIGIRDKDFFLKELKKFNLVSLKRKQQYANGKLEIDLAWKWLESILDSIRETTNMDETKAWKLILTKKSKELKLIQFEDPKVVTEIRKSTIGDDFENYRKTLTKM